MDTEMWRCASEREWRKAERAYQKYKHVSIVEKVSGPTGYGARDRIARSIVVLPQVRTLLLGRVHVFVQVPFLLLTKIFSVYGALILKRRFKDDLVCTFSGRHCNTQLLDVELEKQNRS